MGWRRSGKSGDSRAEVFSALLKLNGDGRDPWSLAPLIFISPMFFLYLFSAEVDYYTTFGFRF